MEYITGVTLLMTYNRPSLHRQYSRVPEYGYIYICITYNAGTESAP